MSETKYGVRVQWEALRSFCEKVLGAAERYDVSPETLESGRIASEETQR